MGIHLELHGIRGMNARLASYDTFDTVTLALETDNGVSTALVNLTLYFHDNRDFARALTNSVNALHLENPKSAGDDADALSRPGSHRTRPTIVHV